MIDFENTFISTFKEFPTVIIKGCFFHFTQCVWRKRQILQFYTIFNRINNNNKKNINMK